jgi:hypothetical protein
VSQLSEVTDDVYAESAADADQDLGDYNRLMQQTKKRMHVLGKLPPAVSQFAFTTADSSVI